MSDEQVMDKAKFLASIEDGKRKYDEYVKALHLDEEQVMDQAKAKEFLASIEEAKRKHDEYVKALIDADEKQKLVKEYIEAGYPMTVNELDDLMCDCGKEMLMYGCVQYGTLRALNEVIGKKKYIDGTQSVLGAAIEAWYNSGTWRPTDKEIAEVWGDDLTVQEVLDMETAIVQENGSPNA